jgi:hypothetical protein
VVRVLLDVRGVAAQADPFEKKQTLRNRVFASGGSRVETGRRFQALWVNCSIQLVTAPHGVLVRAEVDAADVQVLYHLLHVFHAAA